ncbi:hypothetical protein HY382_01920 [Candidatus Curtissbacteria bacterium]|nr:hypothetical protein [Candidatus Curtissbacteria bacterium]
MSRSNLISMGYVGVYTLENIPAEILYLVTDPLIVTDPAGKPKGALASHWTVSEDGKNYVVFLKDNLSWHDVSEVSAKDLSIAIQGVQITALNNKAIEFKLPNPIASFPLILNKPVFKSKTFYGTGEFRIVNIEKIGDSVKKISLVPKNKQLPKVEIKFYDRQEQALNALQIGEIKTASLTNSAFFENWPNLEVEKSTDFGEEIVIFFDNNDKIFSSKELRQALTYAINRENLEGHLSDSPVSPNSWAYNDSLKRYEYNPAKARELLSKAQIQQKIVLSTTEDLKNLAENIAEDWRSIGVDCEVKIEKEIPSNFQALLAVQKLGQDPDQYSLWHSTQTKTNITRYKNVKIDKLLEDGRVTQDEAKRKELYADFQRFLTEDAPAAFLYHPYKYRVTYKNAKRLLSKLPKEKNF